MDRIKSGIPGFDEITEGGIIKGSSILLKGPSGTGKTIAALQYLYKGVEEYDENGLLVQVHGYPSDIEWYQAAFNWDFSTISAQNRLIFTVFSSQDFSKFEARNLHSEVVLQLYKIIDEMNVKRIAFDSVTPLGFYFNEKGEYRNMLHSLSKSLKEKGCTTLFISETRPDGISFFEEEDFVFDGVLRLSRAEEKGQRITQLYFEKMVATDVPKQPFPVDITGNGMMVIPPF